ncbi:beta-defensin 1 [Ochotona princeps]|uniref:beta-defensin 1 n=1 Tax=Ochotona princeps TaxID=9978 RepID=UPI0027145208|nr:beta-defensin 1 [Ochotona princeps]
MATMQIHYLLLLTFCCLLFFQPAQGSDLLTSLGHRSDQYKCLKNGGICRYSPCPLYSRVEGTCYSGRAKCCM